MLENGATFRADHAHDLPALRSQLASQRVLVVAAEAAHHLLQVEREVHRHLVDRQMLVSSHSSYRCRGDTPLHPPNHQITRMTESLRIHPLSAAHTPDKEGDAEVGLIELAHDAIAEAHEPRVAAIRSEGSRRP